MRRPAIPFSCFTSWRSGLLLVVSFVCDILRSFLHCVGSILSGFLNSLGDLLSRLLNCLGSLISSISGFVRAANTACLAVLSAEIIILIVELIGIIAKSGIILAALPERHSNSSTRSSSGKQSKSSKFFHSQSSFSAG